MTKGDLASVLKDRLNYVNTNEESAKKVYTYFVEPHNRI
jgi:hypothetical protein